MRFGWHQCSPVLRRLRLLDTSEFGSLMLSGPGAVIGPDLYKRGVAHASRYLRLGETPADDLLRVVSSSNAATGSSGPADADHAAPSAGGPGGGSAPARTAASGWPARPAAGAAAARPRCATGRLRASTGHPA